MKPPRTGLNGLVFLLAVGTLLYLRPRSVVAVKTPQAQAVEMTALAAPAPVSQAPELPRESVDTTWPATSGTTVLVEAGGDLQRALDAARPGDVIALAPGATFTGPFTLPVKDGEGWIVVRTAAPDDWLPAQGTRLDPSASALLPKLESAEGPVLVAAPGAHHYRFVGLEIRPAPGVFLHNLVVLGESETSLAELPHHLVFDRCYVHGDPAKGARRGIALNSRHTAVIDSYFSDFKEVGADSQAIAGWNGAGPFKIVNNTLQGAGENLLFGGADPAIPHLVPADIEVRGNHFWKPLSWRIGDPAYEGTPWTVKNLFELKNARRVLVEGNLFEHNWVHAQAGFAILFTVRNQDGSAPWSAVEDVTFANNVVRGVAGGVNILGHDEAPSAQTRRVAIRNNLFLEVGGGRWGTEGKLFQLLEGTAQVAIEHNTALQTGNIVMADGEPHRGFVFKDNIVPHNAYGIIGANTGPGRATLELHFPGSVVEKNVIVGANAAAYPPGNFFPGTLAEVGFSDLARGDLRLGPGSPYRKTASDGRDIGADFDALAGAFAAAAPAARLVSGSQRAITASPRTR